MLKPEPLSPESPDLVEIDVSKWHDYLVKKGLQRIEVVPDLQSRYFRAVAKFTFKDGSKIEETLNS